MHVHLLFCVHLVIFILFFGSVELRITSTPPLGCIHYAICNSYIFHSFLLKPCVLIPDILKMYPFLFCAVLIYSFSYILYVELRVFASTRRRTWDIFTSATLMGLVPVTQTLLTYTFPQNSLAGECEMGSKAKFGLVRF